MEKTGIKIEKRELNRFDVFYDKNGVSGWKDSYWIVFRDNDGSWDVGRLGPFNMRCYFDHLREMKFIGNVKEDKGIYDLWKSNPPVPTHCF